MKLLEELYCEEGFGRRDGWSLYQVRILIFFFKTLGYAIACLWICQEALWGNIMTIVEGNSRQAMRQLVQGKCWQQTKMFSNSVHEKGKKVGKDIWEAAECA